MHLWTLTSWEKYYGSQTANNRRGLRLNFDKTVHPEVRRSLKEFCRWIRANYHFPIRVPVYVKSSPQIRAMDGEMVSGTFFGPWDHAVEPYIRLSTGDYEDLLTRRGQDNALAAILNCLAHELTHYYQWINDVKLTEIGEERQAKAYAGFIMDEYADTREHP